MEYAPTRGVLRRAFATSRARRSLAGAVALSVAACGAVAIVGTYAGAHQGVHARDVAAVASPPPATETPSWSGELAWASKNGATAFDHVTGAWVQPAVVPSSSPEYADTWVGIDGYGGKLLQAGTTASSDGGTVSYQAWFVAWTGGPSGMTVLSEPVTAGDHLRVAIDRAATGSWNVQLADATAGWSWSTTVDYPATGASAEWIEEAPGTWSTRSRYQTLADYGSVTFTTVRADGTAPSVVTGFEVAQGGTVTSYPTTYAPAAASFVVRYGAPATISSLSPPTGPAAGGSTVEITGEHFGSSPVVRFGGVAATVLTSSTTSIVVRTPPHVAGSVPVTVDAPSSGAASFASTDEVAFDYVSDPGYVVAFASGRIDTFAGAHLATVAPRTSGTVVGVARDVATGGFWEATAQGGVYNVGAPDLGTLSAAVQRLHVGSVAGIAATPTGTGYWLATSMGDVYDFGNAGSFGTLRGSELASRIVGIASSATGKGYWLVGSDGGVFTFGDAHFYGSAGALHLREPIVGMSATPTGGGYWLVASDGGVFTYGDAHFYGSAGAIHLRAPIVSMSATPTGGGYWLVASDGGVFTFGAATFAGSAAGAGQRSASVGILPG